MGEGENRGGKFPPVNFFIMYLTFSQLISLGYLRGPTLLLLILMLSQIFPEKGRDFFRAVRLFNVGLLMVIIARFNLEN